MIATEVALAWSDADEAGLPAVSASAHLMGGRVSVHARPTADLAPDGAARAVRIVLTRIGAWANRLTRFDPASELSRLNEAAGSHIAIGPSLTEVLDWGRGAEILSDGIVDVGLLDERLLAESGLMPDDDAHGGPFVPASRRWSFTRRGRGATIERPAGLRFDLDGVAKGWLADRALDLLAGLSAVVDADGDIALRVADGDGWAVGVADPREPGTLLSVLRFDRHGEREARFGVATSGTSVHRWSSGGRARHHLIDPRTGRPAQTDVVQATVIARTARAAEAFAKTAVIVGSDASMRQLDRPDVLGLLLVTATGSVLVTPSASEYLS